jgi:hypothetical protein
MDLLKLTFNPVEEAKVFKMAFRQNNCLASACMTRRVSSAYCTTGKSALGYGIGSLKIPLSFRPFMTYWRISAANTNKSGDRGSPCLTPLLQVKFFPGTPFNKTEADPEDKIASTH